MKLLSYTWLVSGIALLISSIIFDFRGTIGFLFTLLSIGLIIFSVVINRKIREFIGNLIINLF